MIHVVSDAFSRVTHLPTFWKWIFFVDPLCSGVFPLRGTVSVVDKVDPATIVNSFLPSIWKWSEPFVTRYRRRCKVQAPISDMVDGSVLAHLLEMLKAVDHVCVWTLPGRRTCVMIDVVNPSSRVGSSLPTGRKWHGTLPSRRLGVVINVVHSAI